MGSRYLTEMDVVLAMSGLHVVGVPGWQTRARGSGGYDGAPQCIVVHHTASQTSTKNDVNYMTFNAPAAPIANLYIARDGSVHIMAAGATNTNGLGGPWFGIPKDSANSRAIGIEIGNDGKGEPYPDAQQESVLRTVAALAKYYNIKVDPYVLAHFEWAPLRKIDPSGPSRWSYNQNRKWSMASFRKDVQTLVNLQSPPSPPISLENTMSALDKPARWFDTREWPFYKKLPANTTLELSVADAGYSGAEELVMNIAAVDPTLNDTPVNAWVAAWPGDTEYPGTSNVNAQAGAAVSNLTWVKVGDNGKIAFRSKADVHLIVDVQAVPTDGGNAAG